MAPRFFLLLPLLLAGCARGCSMRDEPASAVDPPEASAPSPLPARCVAEITRAAVASLDGRDPVETLTAACRDGTLSLYALQGSSIVRVERSTAAGRRFGPVRRVTRSAARLGPVAPDAVEGPIAWRAPLAGVESPEGPEREELRAAEGPSWAEVSAPMDAAVAGVGVVAPVGREGRGFAVLASHTTAEGARTARFAVGAQRPADGLWSAELQALEFSLGVALGRVGEGAGSHLEARWIAQGSSRSEAPLGERHVLVAPRGARVGDTAVFAASEFALRDPREGRCLPFSPELCVAPGPLRLHVAGRDALTAWTVAPEGLPDAVAAVGSQVAVLYVTRDADGGGPSQRVLLADLTARSVRELSVLPPEGLPAIDHPDLVACGGELWLAATAALEGEGEVLTAMPLECLAR